MVRAAGKPTTDAPIFPPSLVRCDDRDLSSIIGLWAIVLVGIIVLTFDWPAAMGHIF
jgi:hypothetical protein